MENASTYGGKRAVEYDQIFPADDPSVESTVAGLERIARSVTASPRVLELAVGTGRLAIPLAARGLRIHGIDLEPSMLDALRAKQQYLELADRITIAEGDMTDAGTFTAPDGVAEYDVVFCVFNSLAALPDGVAQLAAIRAASSVLVVGGRLVLEMPVPDLTGFDAERRRVRQIPRSADEVWLETATLDPVAQVIDARMVQLSEARGIRMHPVRHRYLWPHEMDLMAELAGLTLVERHAGWAREPFHPRAARHVSVYAVAPNDAGQQP